MEGGLEGTKEKCSTQEKKQVSWTKSSEELPEPEEEDDDAVYILSGVVDGCSPVLKTPGFCELV